jgi:hypothetical protein
MKRIRRYLTCLHVGGAARWGSDARKCRVGGYGGGSGSGESVATRTRAKRHGGGVKQEVAASNEMDKKKRYTSVASAVASCLSKGRTRGTSPVNKHWTASYYTPVWGCLGAVHLNLGCRKNLKSSCWVITRCWTN